jgi:ribosome-associated heat shock protein Hsp15
MSDPAPPTEGDGATEPNEELDPWPDLEVRLDKWLQVARVFKTRSQATRACNLNRVKVNGGQAKAHRQVALGDRLEVEKGDWVRLLEVKALRDKPLPKADARKMFEDHSPPPPTDSLERLMRRPAVRREKGAGRPTKKERRQLERLRDDR